MIETERLILRRWQETDLAEFHRHCSDPRVMEFLGPVQTVEETRKGIDRMNGFQDSHGYSFWAMERRADGALMGFCGLKPGAEGTPLDGEVEIGWRLGVDYWGQGYAREAAQASLDWGWSHVSPPRIGAITVEANVRSWGLMHRLGMTRAPGTFEYPNMPEGSPLKTCISYFIDRPNTTG